MQGVTVEKLHGEAEKERIRGRIRRVLVIFAILTVIAGVLITGSLIWRDPTHMNNPNEQASQLITMGITLVWGVLIIFFWGMKLSPLLSYRRYLKEIYGGLSREVEGVITELETQTTFRDGLSFYRMIVNVGDLNNPEDERLLYWDAQLGAPTVKQGDNVYIEAHGNDIIGIRRL